MRRGPAVLGAVALLAALLTGGNPAAAFDRTNIPLKNWGGFAVFRDQVYDDLERLVTAGLTGRTILNTKPMSRVEAARIVARAIETIRQDDNGEFNHRRDLEPVLDRLMHEFHAELAALGVRFNGDEPGKPEFFSVHAVDRAQVRLGLASDELRLVNRQGLKLQDGFNAGLTFESRAQVGDFLTIYLQPELTGNEEYGRLRLATGYLKLTIFNVELLVGRDSLFWGPGLRGAMVLSNNAPALDQIRIGSAEPFYLPWFLRRIGPIKVLFFVAELEEERFDDPHARLAGMRVTFSPFKFLELGISRAMMFGGDRSPQPDFFDFVRLIFSPPAGDNRRTERARRSNNVFSVDADLRLKNVDRFMLPARDMRLYGEFGWDDTCCQTAYIPLKDALSYLFGVQFFGMFGQPGLDARFEYANSSRLSFIHDQFTMGYWTRGSTISHSIGRAGENFYSRVTNRLKDNVMLGLEIDRGDARSPVRGFGAVKERTVGGAVDLSWRFWDDVSLFAQYRLRHAENRNFKAGDTGLDHLFLLELTKDF